MEGAEAPLDERVYNRPDIIQWWASQGHAYPPMDEDLIHRYISESPFFDFASNNGLAIDQSRVNMRAFELTCSRRAFEDELRRKRGVEYMITGDPLPITSNASNANGRAVNSGAGSETTTVWNLRKQERRGDGATTTLGTYYLVGENMYQAPSVGDVVGNRLVSAATRLGKFFDAAAGLASFEPATGYAYLPAAKSGSATQASPLSSRQGSVVSTADLQDLRAGSLHPDSSASLHPDSSTTAANTASDARLLARSLQLALEYGDEYTDENPLLGTPGNFSFTHSRAAVQARRRADEEAQARQAVPVTQKKAPASLPPAVMTEAKAAGKERERERERKGVKMGERMKRKRSRANVAGSVVGVGGGGGTVGDR